MEIETVYQDEDLLVANKPPGIITFREGQDQGEFLVDFLVKKFPDLIKVGESPRYGAVHRLDKETSGIILVAKTNESFKHLQKQFKERKVFKEYTALCVGSFKDQEGTIETHIGRSPRDRRKQKVFPLYNPKNSRLAVTKYEVLKNFENYTLIKAIPETGRKHQIRCHLAHIKHPIAGDKMYGTKNQLCPEKLDRHFLHARSIKIKNLKGEFKEFYSEIPNDLKRVVGVLNKTN